MYGSQPWVDGRGSLVDEIQFMLIGSRHICIGSIGQLVLFLESQIVEGL